jgi:hypothetical protein
MSAYAYVSAITHGRPRWHAEGRSPLRGCDERPAHWTTSKRSLPCNVTVR